MRPLLTGLAYAVFVPMSRLFGRRFARSVGRMMTRGLSQFPAGYVPVPSDVFICSYFKSGTNWTMQIAVQIAFRGRAEFEHIHDLVPWPDMPPRMNYTPALEDDGPRRAADRIVERLEAPRSSAT